MLGPVDLAYVAHDGAGPAAEYGAIEGSPSTGSPPRAGCAAACCTPQSASGHAGDLLPRHEPGADRTGRGACGTPGAGGSWRATWPRDRRLMAQAGGPLSTTPTTSRPNTWTGISGTARSRGSRCAATNGGCSLLRTSPGWSAAATCVSRRGSCPARLRYAPNSSTLGDRPGPGAGPRRGPAPAADGRGLRVRAQHDGAEASSSGRCSRSSGRAGADKPHARRARPGPLEAARPARAGGRLRAGARSLLRGGRLRRWCR